MLFHFLLSTFYFLLSTFKEVRIKHYKQTDRPFKKVLIFRDTQTDKHFIIIYISSPSQSACHHHLQKKKPPSKSYFGQINSALQNPPFILEETFIIDLPWKGLSPTFRKFWVSWGCQKARQYRNHQKEKSFSQENLLLDWVHWIYIKVLSPDC